jgi:regulator of protease activity HflC (stomatin/prohibitin superfamily)
MESTTISLIVLALVVVLLLFLIGTSVRIVPQWAKLVVYRFGQTNPKLVRDPGLRFLIPIIDRGYQVDIREQFIEVPRQTAITKDNAPLGVDFLIYWKVIDPLMSLVNVTNFSGALQGVAATSLRSVIGDIVLDEVLSQRERINETLRLKLDEVTERWGGKVMSVEIREILPPPAVQEAMNRQLSAERTRRAVITESEGTRQATINVAEGDKQSAILRAEGDRQAAILRAQGFSNALETIFKAAQGVDQKTMALQYLDALKALGSGPATKFVIPMEFTQFMGPIGAMVKGGMGKGADDK